MQLKALYTADLFHNQLSCLLRQLPNVTSDRFGTAKYIGRNTMCHITAISHKAHGRLAVDLNSLILACCKANSAVLT